MPRNRGLIRNRGLTRDWGLTRGLGLGGEGGDGRQVAGAILARSFRVCGYRGARAIGGLGRLSGSPGAVRGIAGRPGAAAIPSRSQCSLALLESGGGP